jgi:pyruvate/2-oxoglutarate dehydrogenase complex dihydrolipoamide dehydrogenase (E3) component
MNVAGHTSPEITQPFRVRDDGAHGVTRPTITARHFVIGTGSVVSPPPLPALEEVGYITSDHALSLTKLPKSLIVLGGGAIACELSAILRALRREGDANPAQPACLAGV